MIYGLSKVHNEEKIIADTLKIWGKFCGKFYIYDDCSTDSTRDILGKNPKVHLIKGTEWDADRERAEWVNRQICLKTAQKEAKPDDWFVYFDADEQLCDFIDLTLFERYDAISCRLYDCYITEEDKDKPYFLRKWFGPEARNIIFFFKNNPELRYHLPDQREITLPQEYRIARHGIIKHYGKGFSVKHWEDTCDYYIKYWPKYAEKWKQRKGKAIHVLSDFGNELMEL